MLEKYVSVNGKQLRCGITTGTCAAAAAKAALMNLLGQPVNRIHILTPKGWEVDLDIVTTEVINGGIQCTVHKDAGDDPDITHGMPVQAFVRLSDSPGVTIEGGVGVGRVTQKGLSMPPGKAAINPTPRRMITAEMEDLLPAGQGAYVEIRLPKGEELAQRTFNPRLGIVGGLSILGSTGIVEPMSDEAIKKSMMLEVSVAAEAGHKTLILTPGNHGVEMAKNVLHLPTTNLIKIGNYLGFMLDQCLAYEMEKVLIIGHIGKLVRLAGGIYDSYSKVADGRIEIIAANMALLGAPQTVIQQLFDCLTTEAALEIINQQNYQHLYKLLCNKAEQRSAQRVYQKLQVGVAMFSMDQQLLGIGEIADTLLEQLEATIPTSIQQRDYP